MFRASQGTGYSCGADANPWIEKWLGDCIYTTWDTVAFCIGLSSVFFWIIAQLPQFISNFLRSAADALSPWFLAQWLAGDTFNFLGCLLTGDQLKTQIITAGYFIFADIVIITQYVYYQTRNKNTIDFDESLHKGSAYSDVLKSDASRKSAPKKCIDRSFHLKACKDDLNSYDQSLSNATIGATGGISGSSKQVGESSDSLGTQLALLPLFVSDPRQHGSWMYEHRYRLRRLVQEYGLEYGHATGRRLTSLFNNKRKENRSIVQTRSSRRAHESVKFWKKPYHKAVLGIAGLFGLVSTTKMQFFSSVSKVGTSAVGSSFSRRALLALDNSTPASLAKSLLMQVGNPTAAYFVDQPSVLISQQAFSWTMLIGRCLGWGSSALYLGSRLSQLLKNKQRRSAEGLSLGMVTCAVLANLTYGTSIIMRGPSWDNLVGKAPWLAGSLGTVFLDFSIVIQAYYYSLHQKKGVTNEYTPLLA